jgi:hypothetical protein
MCAKGLGDLVAVEKEGFVSTVRLNVINWVETGMVMVNALNVQADLGPGIAADSIRVV